MFKSILQASTQVVPQPCDGDFDSILTSFEAIVSQSAVTKPKIASNYVPSALPPSPPPEKPKGSFGERFSNFLLPFALRPDCRYLEDEWKHVLSIIFHPVLTRISEIAHMDIFAKCGEMLCCVKQIFSSNLFRGDLLVSLTEPQFDKETENEAQSSPLFPATEAAASHCVEANFCSSIFADEKIRLRPGSLLLLQDAAEACCRQTPLFAARCLPPVSTMPLKAEDAQMRFQISSPSPIKSLKCELDKLLESWTSKLKELYMLKSIQDPLTYDSTAAINELEFKVFFKSRSIFARHNINPDTLEPLETLCSVASDPISRSATPIVFGGGSVGAGALCDSDDVCEIPISVSPQVYHRAAEVADDYPFSHSKYTTMDVYQFYLEAKQIPVSQMLQASQKVILSRNWTSSRAELKACRIMQRLEFLKENGVYADRFLKASCSFLRQKTIWDYLHEEMKWMAKDFDEERRWKAAKAKEIAQEAAQVVAAKRTNERAEFAGSRKAAQNCNRLSHFLRNAPPLSEPIFGPPSPPLSVGATLCTDVCDAHLTELQPVVALDESQLHAKVTLPKLRLHDERLLDDFRSVEDFLLVHLSKAYRKNWLLIADAFCNCVEGSSMKTPLQCFQRFQMICANEAHAASLSADARENCVAVNGGAVATEKMAKYLTLFEKIRIFPCSTRQKPKSNHVGAKKQITMALMANVHPSHEASLKKHAIGAEPVDVGELAQRRLHQKAAGERSVTPGAPIAAATAPSNALGGGSVAVGASLIPGHHAPISMGPTAHNAPPKMPLGHALMMHNIPMGYAPPLLQSSSTQQMPPSIVANHHAMAANVSLGSGVPPVPIPKPIPPPPKRSRKAKPFVAPKNASDVATSSDAFGLQPPPQSQQQPPSQSRHFPMPLASHLMMPTHTSPSQPPSRAHAAPPLPTNETELILDEEINS